MKKIFLFIFSLLFVFISPQISFAQEDWQITNFHSDLSLSPNGELEVNELITVNFPTAKHGIYRDIPFVYKTSSGDTKYTKLHIKEVKRDNRREAYAVSSNENNTRIKIGKSDQTITGKHSYLLSYSVAGVVVPYDTYDEVYWNVTGNEWEADIAKADAMFHLPSPGIIQTACYFGVTGSTTQCRDMKQDDKTAIFSTDLLSPSEGMTVAIGFQKNIVPILQVARPKTLWEKLFEPINIGLFLAVTLGGIGVIIRMWWMRGRDLWTSNTLSTDPKTAGSIKPLGAHETVVVEFTPPEKLRPAEMGVLIDERADTLDVTATLIDLARRGYLKIEEIKKTWILGKTDYIFHKGKEEDKQLAAYETEFLHRLFGSENEVSLSSLKRTFYDDLAIVKSKLYEEVVRKNLFMGNPEKIRLKYYLFGGIIAAIPAGLAFLLGTAVTVPSLIAIGAGLTIVGLTLILFASRMPKRSGYGRDIYRRTLGYRLFISGAEKYRQQFYEKHNLFDDILPYAIIFGLTEKFAQAMKDMGIKPQSPSWYSGYGPFQITTFASSMNTFSRTLSSTMASAPHSSGSGGGGSSGGGFGGGGGGSW